MMKMDVEQIIDEVWKRYDDPSVRITITATAQNDEEILINEYEWLHSRLAVEWATELFGDYDAVRIAAAAHDWDRTFPDIRVPYEKEPEKYWDYKIEHSINTANIFYDTFKEDIEPELMADIIYLIKRHEIGGKKDSDGELLYTPDSSGSYNLEEAAEKIQAADSISGFIAFLDESPAIEKRGEEYGRDKIKFYYGRTTPEAQIIIDSLPLSNDSLKILFEEYKSKPDKEECLTYQEFEEMFNRLDAN